jgi:septal ring factor EnvC (AmiA/AmiB activator)
LNKGEKTIMSKETLRNLENENLTLPEKLSAAVRAGNAEEITYLKHRERELPAEIFTARVMALRDEIQELEVDLSNDYQRLSEAKETLKNTDSLVTSQLAVLDQEKARLNHQVMAALVAPSRIQDEIRKKGDRISELKKQLAEIV